MTDQDCVLNVIVINQWIDDLLDKSFGIKFNADIPYGKTFKGKLMGDAALFLAYRQAPVQDDEQLIKWLDAIKVPADEDYLPSEIIVHTYTRIPMSACRALLWPQLHIAHPEFDKDKMKASDFEKTLQIYLETGVVSWQWMLPEDH